MYLNGLTGAAMARQGSASSPPARNPDNETPIEATDRLQEANAVLRAMLDAAEDPEEASKARAKERLKRAKEELEWLQRWSFPAEFTAKQAARLANEVGSIAREFTAALADGGMTGLPQYANASSATDAASPDGADHDTAFGVPPAYREAMDSGREKKTLSASDSEFLEEIKSVAQQLKRLLEEAARKLNSKQASPDDAQEANSASATLTNALAALDSAASGMTISMSLTV